MPSTAAIGTVALLSLVLPSSSDCLQVSSLSTFALHGNRISSSGVRYFQTSSRTNNQYQYASSSSTTTTTTLHLLKGLVSTVDDDIRSETEDANLSSFELFQRELSEGNSIVGAISAVRRRGKDKAGDYENKYKILSDYRAYGNRDLLDTDHLKLAPTLDDLNQVQPTKDKTLWSSGPYRLGVFVSSFFVFPYVCTVLSTLVTITEDEFDIINDQFTPGIGILYGTFVALTLDILYERQNKVQENASVEASLLSQVTQNVLNLFRDNVDIAQEAAQIIADQVRIIVYRSRGGEMLSIMRADPYARLLSIVDHYQRDKDTFTPHEEALIDGLRSEIPSLMEARAKRLSDEASALPPTHFLVLTVLTALSLIGFTAATLTITDADGNPPLESRMVFAGLSAVYVLFFNFCKDMNDPFDGVYQIKRSSAASYLLQIKWLIANQPYGSAIKFDTRGLMPVYDGSEDYSFGADGRMMDATANVQSEQPKPEQKVVASAQMPAPVVSATTEAPKTDTEVKVVAKELSAKDLMPERRKSPADAQVQSKTSQEEMVTQFESVGGFSGETSKDGGVTVPGTNQTPTQPVDKKRIAMNFRKSGGFMK